MLLLTLFPRNTLSGNNDDSKLKPLGDGGLLVLLLLGLTLNRGNSAEESESQRFPCCAVCVIPRLLFNISRYEFDCISFLLSRPTVGFLLTSLICWSCFLSACCSCEISHFECVTSASRLSSRVSRRLDSSLFKRRTIKTLFDRTEGLSSLRGTLPADI